jgi:DNA-binding NarL/FixJ family response regulator
MTIRVLVADDQSMVRAGFRMLLSREQDIEVVAEASNGVEAVEAAARFRPTVVLMDIRMPRLDGLQATRRILAADDTARILILTTFDLDEYIYEALRAGASGFVLKDDPPEQLLAAIRTVAAGDALLSPAVTKRVIRQFARIPQSSPPERLDELTERELDVFRLIARGLSNAEIGQELYISDTTVKTHITHILQKLGLRDRVQAVVLAYETGLFDTRLTIEAIPAYGEKRSRGRRSWRAAALRMSWREMLGERQVAAPLMAQRAAHGAIRLVHRRFQPGEGAGIKPAGLRLSGKPQRPSQCQLGHQPLVLAFALFAPAASRPAQHCAVRRQRGRQAPPSGHTSTVGQRCLRLVLRDDHEQRRKTSSPALAGRTPVRTVRYHDNFERMWAGAVPLT